MEELVSASLYVLCLFWGEGVGVGGSRVGGGEAAAEEAVVPQRGWEVQRGGVLVSGHLCGRMGQQAPVK